MAGDRDGFHSFITDSSHAALAGPFSNDAARAHPGERWEFEREFTWFMRLMILFGLLHLVIFVILLAVPR